LGTNYSTEHVTIAHELAWNQFFGQLVSTQTLQWVLPGRLPGLNGFGRAGAVLTLSPPDLERPPRISATPRSIEPPGVIAAIVVQRAIERGKSRFSENFPPTIHKVFRNFVEN
jgi:hypothetical protein